MKMTFVTRKFRNVERNVHCDVLHITPDRVARLVLDCNGVFAIKAYGIKIKTAAKLNNATNFEPLQICAVLFLFLS